MLEVGSVVINVSDVQRATAFWSAALAYTPVGAVQHDWVVLGPPEGAGVQVSINLSDQAPPAVPHVHLDLYPAPGSDQATEVERLLGLGATEVPWPLYPDDGGDYVVLADPDGNRFCVIDR